MMQMTKYLITLIIFFGCKSDMKDWQQSKVYTDWEELETYETTQTQQMCFSLILTIENGDTVCYLADSDNDTVRIPIRQITKSEVEQSRSHVTIYSRKPFRKPTEGGSGIEPLQTQEGDY